MPLKKTELTNILFSNHIPLLNYVLKTVATDYNISYEELEKKYIKPFRSTRKRNTNKKGKKTCYSMFLADKEVEEDLKNRNPNMNFGELSKEKAKVWKVMSQKDKERYKELANEYNSQLDEEEIIEED
jgi:hypothetical protein